MRLKSLSVHLRSLRMLTSNEKKCSIYIQTVNYSISWIRRLSTQIALDPDTIGESLKFVKENMNVTLVSHNGTVFQVEAPLHVELLVTECEPGEKGNTAQGATKPCTVETGANVNVPLFVNQGDTLKIDTRTGEYLSRV